MMTLQRRASQASVILVVVGLHLAGVLIWWSAERGMRWAHDNAQPPSIAVWLPALEALDTKQPTDKTIAKPPTQAPAARRRRDSTAEEQRRAQSPTTMPASTDISLPIPSQPGGPAEAQTQAQSQTAQTLNLNLSRIAIASVAPPSFAEQSPFHGRPPPTVERLIASAAAETGPWTEERIDNDHIRFRRGNTCVTMQRPRAAIIDPFNEAAARIPWRASNAETCE